MKKLVPLSLAAIAATLVFTNTGLAADRHAELVGIGAASPQVGPSTIVRTEVTWRALTETDIRAAQLDLVSLPTRVVERYEVVRNGDPGCPDPRHDELAAIGAHSPVLGLTLIPATSVVDGVTIARD